MNSRQYNFDIDTYYGRVYCNESELKQVFDFDVARSSESYNQGGITHLVVGASNELNALIAANEELQSELQDIQSEMSRKIREIKCLTNYMKEKVRSKNETDC